MVVIDALVVVLVFGALAWGATRSERAFYMVAGALIVGCSVVLGLAYAGVDLSPLLPLAQVVVVE